jgi:hypothetical protein
MRLVVFEQWTDERRCAIISRSQALLIASTPTIVCAICSASLAYKERPQWLRFAVLAVLAEVGSIVTRRAVQAQQLAWHVG